MSYQVRKQSSLSADYVVEREIPCINGLSAWFTVCVVPQADEAALGYTDGEYGSALERANEIAAALSKKARTVDTDTDVAGA